ncbi:MAG: class I SAM-dependent methyltransferase [bacterium]|nr:class I SAM-dependent methyltransferase [bacterium]
MAYTDINSEDRLVQRTFAKHLEHALGWESVYAWNEETFGPSGTLGRAYTREVVLDPTCGSGTTAYVAEQWGRRWITVDTSRVAIALARTRVMSARFPYYLLADVAGRPAPWPLPPTDGTSRRASSISGCPMSPSSPSPTIPISRRG